MSRHSDKPRRRGREIRNILGGQQQPKPYVDEDKQWECEQGDWVLIGNRPEGDQLVLATEETMEAAIARRQQMLDAGLEGYSSITIEEHRYKKGGKHEKRRHREGYRRHKKEAS